MHTGDFERQGYCILPSIIPQAELQLIERVLEEARQHPAAARQCTYFEKSAAQNWLVAYHQDLSIPVQKRVPHAALSGWSEKDGALFVQAPFETLEKLVALRLHIDDCGPNDGALRVVPGSHQLGRLDEATKSLLRQEPGEVLCPVEKGGGMAMNPLLLHASSKTTGSSRRRVLHFLFGPPDLPCGLSWPT